MISKIVNPDTLKKVVRINLYALMLLFIIAHSKADAQNQENLNIIKNNWLAYSDAPNSLYHYLTGEAFNLLKQRAAVVDQLKSISDWEKRQEYVRNTLWDILGPFPEKTPLNAKVIRKFKKDGYSVENIIYESLPGYYVTASLFIPDKVKRPAPAILFCSGHSAEAYRRDLYQLPLLNLVKKGFIVLAFDPAGQGERLQYFDPEKGESVIGSSTKEHSYSAVQVFLTSRSIARYFIWDGIRGIDYLASRKEVDRGRIGVHGLSGGGTQTAYISALDDRVKASAPCGYITSYKRLLESIGVQDGEQNLYHQILMGIDHADFIEARAPKPTLIMATTRDFFSIQGTRETYDELKRVYSIYGKPDLIEMVEDDYEHGYTKKIREAMYGFFQKHLSMPGSPTEEEVDFCSQDELKITATGQVSTSLGGETLFSLNRQEAEKLLSRLEKTRSDSPAVFQDKINIAAKLSGYKPPAEIMKQVFTGRHHRDNYTIEKYYFKGEGDYIVPYLLMIPEKTNNKALIYLHPAGKTAEAEPGGEIEWFVKQGFTVAVPDLIGTGEMGPGDFRGDAVIGGVSYNMWFTSVIIGKSIVGLRASDLVRLRILLSERNDINEIYGLAKKEMTPVLLFAAAFDDNIRRIALIEPFSSYRSLVMNQFYYPGFVQNLVPGALTEFDIPDILSALAPRKLMISGVTDANGKLVDQKEIQKDLGFVRTAYMLKKSEDQLNIISPGFPGDLSDHYSAWLK